MAMNASTMTIVLLPSFDDRREKNPEISRNSTIADTTTSAPPTPRQIFTTGENTPSTEYRTPPAANTTSPSHPAERNNSLRSKAMLSPFPGLGAAPAHRIQRA